MNKKNIITYIVSLFLSISLIFSFQILKYYERGSLRVGENIHFNLFLALITLITSFCLYFLLKLFLMKFSKLNISKSIIVWNDKKVFIISFVLIFFSGLIFLLYCYPGAAMVDSYQLLIDPIGYSFQYPLVYSIVSSKLFNIFYNITGSMNLSFFFLSFIQLIIISLIISYAIKFQHSEFKCNKATFLILFYFCFFTIFSNLNISHLRDTWFSAFFLIIIMMIYKVIKTNGTIFQNENFIILSCIAITGLLLSRNNGVLIIAVVLLYFLIRYKKFLKYIFFMIIVFAFSVNICIFLPNNKKNSLFQESVAVPFQQLAYTIKYGHISDDDLSFISEIIPVDIVKTKYSGFTFDRLKWGLMFNNFELNNKKNEFMRVWLKNMIPNYKLYIKAYMLNTCDLWAFLPFKYSQGILFELQKKDLIGFQYFEKLNNEQILPDFIYNILDFFYKNYCVYFSNGMLFWIYVLLVLILVYKEKKEYLPVFIPFLLIWVNLMLMSPLASAFRYMAMFGYCLPFIIVIVFYDKKLNN